MMKPSSLRALCVSLVLMWLSSCTATSSQRDERALESTLEASRSVLVIIPDDGWYEEQVYAGSGAHTSTSVAEAFADHAPRVEQMRVPPGRTAHQVALDAGAGYLVIPRITHWEDRATEWSGKRDRIGLTLTLFEPGKQEPLAAVEIEGKSKWATFGGDHPQDLLAKPIRACVARWYGI
jgi:hypothetical protein